jgi:hypothetical protein
MNDNDSGERYTVRVLAKKPRKMAPIFEGWFYVSDPDNRCVSMYFQTRAQADRCRDVLIADDRRRSAPQPPGAA